MSLAQNISNQSSIGDSSSWSRVQDKVFEEAIVVFPEGTQDRWEKIATQVLGKSPLEVRRHYEVLVHDLLEIDSGRVELPSYEDEFDTVGQGSEYSEGPVDFGSKAKETQRRRGVPWTEEEHRKAVKSRTPTQVASHAQKYFLRQNSVKKERKKCSIHDITTVEEAANSVGLGQINDQIWEMGPAIHLYDQQSLEEHNEGFGFSF
ncbi:transcription factor srm1 [Quercus suber]|uniref:Transcription factor srm1 n=1 Tax=Quercus suber TaxID=58331 RepID=A0AAW0LPG3_QUESU